MIANDEILLKQIEMRDTIVLVRAGWGSGSGTIIDCLETNTEGTFEYHVLTNAHVTDMRLITILRGVNSLTGKIKTGIIDTGCEIITFDHNNKDWSRWSAKIIKEDTQVDLAILSFQSDQKYSIALMADDDMLKQVRVFDEIFTIGCQLGGAPIPTVGIISQILTGDREEQRWIVYASTAQITPGSSGGGLFKKYDNHYYLIGVPYQVAVAHNGQFIPHLSHVISLSVVKDFICQCSTPYANE
jgi:S1-C subfamily serine protease